MGLPGFGGENSEAHLDTLDVEPKEVSWRSGKSPLLLRKLQVPYCARRLGECEVGRQEVEK